MIECRSLQNQSSKLLPNDSLTFVCYVTNIGFEETIEVVKEREASHQVQRLEGLCQDFKKLFSNKEMSDVKIHCEDQVFDNSAWFAGRRPNCSV